jgi:hypothetical protein
MLNRFRKTTFYSLLFLFAISLFVFGPSANAQAQIFGHGEEKQILITKKLIFRN